MEEEKKEKTSFSKVFLTCSSCGHFPISIDNVSHYSYSEEYSITTKCPKCKDVKFKHVPKGIFEKLDLKSL